jgi:hypothetical protein
VQHWPEMSVGLIFTQAAVHAPDEELPESFSP